jgi:ABC-2 type transport system permease protein
MTGLFVLIFFSNVLVAPDTLPRGLEAIVGLNPISHLVTAVRGLFAGAGDAGDIALVVGGGPSSS